MSFLIGALKIIFVLGFLILIHEGGHFLVAKACKVKVKEFSIGFGPKIWVHQGSETKYTLRLIPLGGFVDMLGEAERKDEEGSFSSSPVWKRVLIVIAGATVNIVFGLVVYFSWIAIDFNQVSTVVDNISQEYSENLRELLPNDQIINIEGKNIHIKSDLDNALENLSNKEIKIIVKRDGDEKELKVKPTQIITKYIGIYYSIDSNSSSQIQYIQPDSPAEKAGLKVKDKIVKINGIETNDPNGVLENINSNNISFKIVRDGIEKDIELIAQDVPKYIFGITLKPAEASIKNRLYYGYWQTIAYLKEIGSNLKDLVTGNVNVNQMMGPIGISEVIVKTKGFSEFVYFLSIISLSLGISNLLPIPALDGGKLLLLIIEAIRRKPLNEQLEIKIQLLGFSFLILLSIYIAFNDIIRVF